MGKQVRVDTSQITTDRDWRRIEVEVRELREELSKLRMELSQTMDRIKSLKENYRRLEHEQRILKKNIPVRNFYMKIIPQFFRNSNVNLKMPGKKWLMQRKLSKKRLLMRMRSIN